MISPPFLQIFSSYAKKVPSFSTLTRHAPSRDPFAIAHALSMASASRSPSMGSQLHAQALKLGMSHDAFTMNHLLVFYSRCGLVARALELFDEMPHRNGVSWTALVSGSIRNGALDIGFSLFVSMMRNGFCSNEFALSSMLSACDSVTHLKLGLSLHAIALKVGLDGNPYVGSSLLLMYARHGHIGAAECVFAHIGYKDLACWNAMLEGYLSNSCGYEAMRTAAVMHRCGLAADQFTYITAVKACLIAREWDFGRQLHSLVIHSMFESDTSVMNALVDMYFKAGVKDIAMATSSRIQQKDTVSWNTVISGFAHDEDERAVVGCLADMSQKDCKPNQVTFSVILRLSGSKENASLGLQIFGLAYRHGYSDNVLVANAVINMLSRCGLLNCAYSLFCNLSFRNVVTWNEMIAVYGLYGYSEEAFRLFRGFVRIGERPDEFTYSAVLSASQDARNNEQLHASIVKHGFASCEFVSTSLIKADAAFGSVQSSLKIIQDACKMNLVSWGVIISAFLKRGLNDKVLSLFNLFRGDCRKRPDEFILATLLNACANAALIRQCRCVHSLVVKTGHIEHFCVASSVVDAYAKCGDIASAKSAFSASSVTDDAIMYNTMLTAYANHGLIEEALSLYEEMTRAHLAPTPATFVAVVSACSHLGLVEQGKHVFGSMLSVHGMHPTRDNYACLVDLLARKGLLDEAKGVIKAMPFQPWAAVWRSLMNGCRIHGNKEIGVLAAKQIMRMAPSSDGAYVSLSNVYADKGEWESAEETRRSMVQNQVQKVQGYSMVEIDVG